MPDKPPKAVAVEPPSSPVEEEPKAKRQTTSKRPRGRPKDRRARLQSFIEFLAMPFAAMDDFHCAEVVTKNAEPVAKAWADLAQENKSVAHAIDKMLEGGAWGAVVISTGGMILPIMAHHNLYPKRFGLPFGAVMEEPDTEAEVNGAGPPGVVTQPPPPPNPPTNG